MMALALESWISLFYFDIVLRFRGLQRIHDIVRNQQVCSVHGASIPPASKLCRFGMCLLLQTGFVSAAFCSDDGLVTPIRTGSGNGYRGSGTSLQVSRMG
jgi:hypothetical protein